MFYFAATSSIVIDTMEDNQEDNDDGINYSTNPDTLEREIEEPSQGHVVNPPAKTA